MQLPYKKGKQKKTNRTTNMCRDYYNQFVHVTYYWHLEVNEVPNLKTNIIVISPY